MSEKRNINFKFYIDLLLFFTNLLNRLIIDGHVGFSPLYATSRVLHREGPPIHDIWQNSCLLQQLSRLGIGELTTMDVRVVRNQTASDSENEECNQEAFTTRR